MMARLWLPIKAQSSRRQFPWYVGHIIGQGDLTAKLKACSCNMGWIAVSGGLKKYHLFLKQGMCVYISIHILFAYVGFHKPVVTAESQLLCKLHSSVHGMNRPWAKSGLGEQRCCTSCQTNQEKLVVGIYKTSSNNGSLQLPPANKILICVCVHTKRSPSMLIGGRVAMYRGI